MIALHGWKKRESMSGRNVWSSSKSLNRKNLKQLTKPHRSGQRCRRGPKLSKLQIRQSHFPHRWPNSSLGRLDTSLDECTFFLALIAKCESPSLPTPNGPVGL